MRLLRLYEVKWICLQYTQFALSPPICPSTRCQHVRVFISFISRSLVTHEYSTWSLDLDWHASSSS